MKYLTLFSLLFMQLLVLGQSRNKPIAVIAATKNNFVYKEISNPIAIAVSGHYDKDLLVKTSVGKIEKVERSSYYLFLDSSINEKTVTITVFVRKKNGLLLNSGNYEFNILPFPEPNLALNNVFEKDSVSFEEINKTESIYLYHKDFALNGIKYKIKNFTFIHITKGKAIFVSFVGNQLTKQMKESLLLAENNDKVCFTGIKVLGPAGLKELKTSLVLKIYKN